MKGVGKYTCHLHASAFSSWQPLALSRMHASMYVFTSFFASESPCGIYACQLFCAHTRAHTYRYAFVTSGISGYPHVNLSLPFACLYPFCVSASLFNAHVRRCAPAYLCIPLLADALPGVPLHSQVFLFMPVSSFGFICSSMPPLAYIP